MNTAVPERPHPGPAQADNRLVVIGASLGGLAALPEILGGLPRAFPSPVLVVMHIDAHDSKLPAILASRCAMPVSYAADKHVLERGRIYVAPPDQHMVVDGPLVTLNRLAREHHSRPAIDPLFRSAALTRGSDVIGVVLTGMLTDGTFGLQAIKAAGGVAIAQDPDEAVEPSMPRSALRWVDVDHRLRLQEIGPALEALIVTPRPAHHWTRRAQIETEDAVFARKGDPVEELKSIAVPSMFVCPECKGGLWSLKDAKPARFRCHTGHAYGMDTLEHSQAEATDEALWTAARGIQEKIVLMEKIAAQHRQSGENEHATQIERDLAIVRKHLESLMRIVTNMPGSTARI